MNWYSVGRVLVGAYFLVTGFLLIALAWLLILLGVAVPFFGFLFLSYVGWVATALLTLFGIVLVYSSLMYIQGKKWASYVLLGAGLLMLLTSIFPTFNALQLVLSLIVLAFLVYEVFFYKHSIGRVSKGFRFVRRVSG